MADTAQALATFAFRAKRKLEGSGHLTRHDRNMIVSVIDGVLAEKIDAQVAQRNQTMRMRHHQARDLAFLRELRGHLRNDPAMAATMVDDWIHELEHERRD